MAIGPTPGQVIDLYREHVIANPTTYSTASSGLVYDDLHYAAVRAETPYAPANKQTVNAYGATEPGSVGGVVVRDSWAMQLRQALVQT